MGPAAPLHGAGGIADLPRSAPLPSLPSVAGASLLHCLPSTAALHCRAPFTPPPSAPSLRLHQFVAKTSSTVAIGAVMVAHPRSPRRCSHIQVEFGRAATGPRRRLAKRASAGRGMNSSNQSGHGGGHVAEQVSNTGGMA
jgi:hypothetical protein